MVQWIKELTLPPRRHVFKFWNLCKGRRALANIVPVSSCMSWHACSYMCAHTCTRKNNKKSFKVTVSHSVLRQILVWLLEFKSKKRILQTLSQVCRSGQGRCCWHFPGGDLQTLEPGKTDLVLLARFLST